MCGFCDDEYLPDEDDFDEEEAWAVVTENDQNSQDTDSLKLRFIELLCKDDQAALAVVAEFMEPDLTITRPDPPTRHTYNIWGVNTAEDDGFFRYRVGHDLETESVLVSIDTDVLYSYVVMDDSTVNVVSPKSLHGASITVVNKEA